MQLGLSVLSQHTTRLATIGSWQDPDALGRPDLRWHTLLFELC